MKATLLILSVLVSATAQAQMEIKSCREASISLDNLVTPVQKNSKSFYNGKVTLYNIDTVEPAAASAGLAVVLPPTEEEDPTGGLKCLSLSYLSAVDVTKARTSYDETRGLLLMIPAKQNVDGESTRSITLKLRIHLKKSTVKIE